MRLRSFGARRAGGYRHASSRHLCGAYDIPTSPVREPVGHDRGPCRARVVDMGPRGQLRWRDQGTRADLTHKVRKAMRTADATIDHTDGDDRVRACARAMDERCTPETVAVRGRVSTQSSRLIVYKADSQRIILLRGQDESREPRDQRDKPIIGTPRPRAATAIVGSSDRAPSQPLDLSQARTSSAVQPGGRLASLP